MSDLPQLSDGNLAKIKLIVERIHEELQLNGSSTQEIKDCGWSGAIEEKRIYDYLKTQGAITAFEIKDKHGPIIVLFDIPNFKAFKQRLDAIAKERLISKDKAFSSKKHASQGNTKVLPTYEIKYIRGEIFFNDCLLSQLNFSGENRIVFEYISLLSGCFNLVFF